MPIKYLFQYVVSYTVQTTLDSKWFLRCAWRLSTGYKKKNGGQVRPPLHIHAYYYSKK